MNKTDFDILCFGSITLDRFVLPNYSDIQPSNEENFILHVGEKIKLQDTFKSCGGSAANSGIGFAKLGLKVGIIGFVGDDEMGQFILKELKKEKVDTSHLIIQKNIDSSFSIILNTPTGRKTVLHYRNEKEDFDPSHLRNAPKSKAIYIGHLYKKSEDMLREIPKWRKKTSGFVAWNPGRTQFTEGFDKFKFLFPSIDLLILNTNEAEKFSGIKAKKIKLAKAINLQVGKKITLTPEYKPNHLYDLRKIAKKFLDAGIKKLVITGTKRGVQVFDGKTHIRAAAPDVKIKSTLGAGDAFSAGIVSAILYDKDLREQVLWGSWNAAKTIEKLGTQNGQATKKKLEQIIKT